MGWKELPVGLRFLCVGCAGQSFTLKASVESVRSLIKRMSYRVHRHDSSIYEPEYTRAELQDAMTAVACLDQDDSLWQDAYYGQPVALRDGHYPPEIRERGMIGQLLAHPVQMSLEKPHNSFLGDSGTINLHHPKNVAMIKDCINRLNGTLSPSAIPMHKRALQLRKKTDGRPPVRGHHADVEKEWMILERVSFRNE